MLLTRISIDANKPEQFETALGMVLSSPSRGKLIKTKTYHPGFRSAGFDSGVIF